MGVVRRRLTAAAFTLAALGLASAALASFTSGTAPVALSVSTATLAAPTGVDAARGTCVILVSTEVNVTWTASASTFADGYEISRSTSSGGPYSVVGTVNGWSTTSFTDTTVAFATTYYYVVQAKKLNWLSVNSNQDAVTTHTSLCV